MFATDKIVFLRTLDAVPWPNSRICDDDAVTYVEHLKAASDVQQLNFRIQHGQLTFFDFDRPSLARVDQSDLRRRRPLTNAS